MTNFENSIQTLSVENSKKYQVFIAEIFMLFNRTTGSIIENERRTAIPGYSAISLLYYNKFR